MKNRKRTQRAALLAAVLAVLLTGCLSQREPEPVYGTPSDGQIYLYGESHSQQAILDRELELWGEFYRQGMRDMFVELPCYTAEFMNLWMEAEDDTILDQLYADWTGTALDSSETRAYFLALKEQYPETIFHGTDVGHQYNTTGERYLEYLRDNALEDSEEYALAQAAMEQGRTFYQTNDAAYRENAMAQNFIQEFDRLEGRDVMGVYGSAHTGLESMDSTGAVPCMANQLRERYGEAVHSEDLRYLIAGSAEPVGTGTIDVGGKEYQALYFGRQDLSAVLPQFQYREFWRLEDAYDDMKDRPTTGDMLPYNNFPMAVETGQVFVVDYTLADGTVMRKYYRSDGNLWQDVPTTEEFTAD